MKKKNDMIINYRISLNNWIWYQGENEKMTWLLVVKCSKNQEVHLKDCPQSLE